MKREARGPRVGAAVSSLAAAMALLCAAGRAAVADEPPKFDHTATRFVLTGSHEGVPCEGCHAMGVFEGTPTDCQFCHDGSGMRAESGKPIDHIPTSNHCEDCHTSDTWLEVRFDHVAVTGTCASCHNGSLETGKPMDHIPTTAGCENCHNTITWSNARFDHSGVTGACSSCHNGSVATGKPNDHVPTTAECDLCHSTRAWEPAMFDHSGITAPCSSCHNGTEATGKPNDHFITMQECDNCHTTAGWSPDTFRHSSANYPGDHAQDLDCRECHPGNSEMVVYKDDPSLAPDCGGCHRNDFQRDEHKKYENPETNYTAQELRDCTGACHTYRDATMTEITDSRNREHRVRDREF